MANRHWESGRSLDEARAVGPVYATEYAAIQKQRAALILQYNIWYAIGLAKSIASFWLIVYLSVSIGSLPLMIGAGTIGTCIAWFAYRVVLTIDRGVVELYPRIVFLELVLEFDFYRDYLRRRPRGDTERSYIEKCEQIDAETTVALWREIYSQFNAKDFPGDRRVTTHFKQAAYLSVAMYWIIVAVTILPQYFGVGR